MQCGNDKHGLQLLYTMLSLVSRCGSHIQHHSQHCLLVYSVSSSDLCICMVPHDRTEAEAVLSMLLLCAYYLDSLLSWCAIEQQQFEAAAMLHR
jgi:hypothetical protein